MDHDEAANLALEVSLRAWLATHLPQHASILNDLTVSIHDALKSGIILCDMMNVIKPGSMKKISTINTAYKQLENVQNYLNMCKIMGMQASQVFESADLVNGRFKTSILINLKTLQGIHERVTKSTAASSSTSTSSASGGGSAPSAASSAKIALSATSSTSLPSSSASPRATPSYSTSSPRAAGKSVSVSNASDNGGAGKETSVQAEVIKNVVNNKPDEKTVAIVTRWLEVLLTMRKPAGKSVFEWLKSGVILLRVLNVIKPGVAKGVYEGNIVYKQVENVQRYVKLVPLVIGTECPLFSVPDLADERDLLAVTNHLHAMITIVQRDQKWTGPTLDSVKSSAFSAPESDDSAAPSILPSTLPPSEIQSTPQALTSTPVSSSSIPPQTTTTQETTNSAEILPNSMASSPFEVELEQERARQEESLREKRRMRIEQEQREQSFQLESARAEREKEIESSRKEQEERQLQQERELLERAKQEEAFSQKIAPAVVESLPSSQSTAATASTVTTSTVVGNTASTSGSSSSDKDELERVRKELEAERLAMIEERKRYNIMMQEESEKRLQEMAKKLAEETAAKLAQVVEDEKRKSTSIALLLEEERVAREKERVAREEALRKLEEERQNREALEQQKRQIEQEKQNLVVAAQEQLHAVAKSLQEETSKRLEQLATQIRAEAKEQTEQELKKKDEHLLKQIDRERLLRARLDALEDEKASLRKTFEKKFASLEAELKSAKQASSAEAAKRAEAGLPSASTSLSSSNKENVTIVSDKQPGVTLSVDSETLGEFQAWKQQWRRNRQLTKQCTRSLTQLTESSTGLVLKEEDTVSLVTPRDLSESSGYSDDGSDYGDLDSSGLAGSPRFEDDHEHDDAPLNLSSSQASPQPSPGQSKKRLDSDDEDEQEGHNDDDEEWSEEEDWGDEYATESSDAQTPRSALNQSRSRSRKSSLAVPVAKDEWSEFSTVNLSRFN